VGPQQTPIELPGRADIDRRRRFRADARRGSVDLLSPPQRRVENFAGSRHTPDSLSRQRDFPAMARDLDDLSDRKIGARDIELAVAACNHGFTELHLFLVALCIFRKTLSFLWN
jgi:hypothetical protein